MYPDSVWFTSLEWPLRVFSVIIGGMVVFLTYHVFSVVKKPRLVHKPDSLLASLVRRHCPLLSEAYRPTIWCSGGRIQTVVSSLFKRKLRIPYRRELLQTPDGGEVALDWFDNGSDTSENRATYPTVLVLPGLTGSSSQNYITNLVSQIAQNGYRVVVFNNRGLGGVALKTPRAFCAANTEDLEFVISSIRESHPEIPLLAVGVCLGGIILKNFLVDFGSRGKNTGLVGAMTVSSPWNLVQSTESLDETMNKFLFNRYLTKCLHKLVRKNRALALEAIPGVQPIEEILKTSTLSDFDKCLTAPMFKFDSVESYYQAASLDKKPIHMINVPLLCLCAADDPFIPSQSVPYDAVQASSNVVLAMTTRGGHIGFSEGFLPTGASYADRLAGQYTKAIFEQFINSSWCNTS